VKAYTKLMGRPPQGPSPGSNFGGGSNVWRDDIPSGSRSFGPGAAGSGRGGGGGGRPPLTPDEQALLGIDPNSARARLTPDEQALLGLSGRGAGGDLQAPQLRQGNFFADPLNAVAPGEMADVRGGPDNPRTYSGAGAGARADRRIPSGPGKLGAKKPMLITCLARCERDNDGFVVFSPHVERVLVVEATIGYGECRQQVRAREITMLFRLTLGVPAAASRVLAPALYAVVLLHHMLAVQPFSYTYTIYRFKLASSPVCQVFADFQPHFVYSAPLPALPPLPFHAYNTLQEFPILDKPFYAMYPLAEDVHSTMLIRAASPRHHRRVCVPRLSQTNQMELCEEMWTFGRIKPNKNALQFRREDLINNLRSLRTMDVRGAIGGSMNRVRSQLSNMRQAMPKVPTPEGVVRSMCNSGADKVNSGPGARTVGAPAQPPKAPVAPRRR
jgi:hypothetical protein